MNNSYFILSDKTIEIEKFHICTWESLNGPSYIEIGAEIKKDSFNDAMKKQNDGETDITLYLAIPYCSTIKKVSDLSYKFTDNDNNARFIFNDEVEGHTNLDADNKNGVILKFKEKKELTILPCAPTINYKDENNKDGNNKDGNNIDGNNIDGLLTIKLKEIPNLPADQETGNYYFRILIETDGIIAEKNNNGLNKTNYIYDLKINKTRNLPDCIFRLKKDNRLNFCDINQLFCFHVVPDTFELSFVHSKALQSVRILESDAFSNYLKKEVSQAGTGHNNIIFLKDNTSKKDGYSFFTVCTDESFGIKQVAWAVLANIFVSLLFASASFRTRTDLDEKSSWISQLPTEYWVALGTTIVILIFLIWGKRIRSCLRHFISWIKK